MVFAELLELVGTDVDEELVADERLLFFDDLAFHFAVDGFGGTEGLDALLLVEAEGGGEAVARGPHDEPTVPLARCRLGIVSRSSFQSGFWLRGREGNGFLTGGDGLRNEGAVRQPLLALGVETGFQC